MKNDLAANKVDLDYAIMKRKQWGNMPYGGTQNSRRMFDQWDTEVKSLQNIQKYLDAEAAQLGKKTYKSPNGKTYDYLEKIPKGWKQADVGVAVEAPFLTITNGKSRFSGERKIAIVSRRLFRLGNIRGRRT